MSRVDWGVFSVARDIWDHPLFLGEPFTKREAWMWIISAAAWRPIFAPHRTGPVLIQRGEFCYSLRFLARKFTWLIGRVERFLNLLEKQDMIRDVSRDDAKIYLVNNYNKFQLGAEKIETLSETQTETVARRSRDKEETFNHSSTKTPSLRSGGATKRKTQIPDSFPSQDLLEAAVKFWTERGRTDLCATVADEAAQFRDRCASAGDTALDWSAKWRTWYRNALKFNKPQRSSVAGRESPLQQAHRIANELANTSPGHEIADHGEDHGPGNALPQIGYDRRRA